MTRTESRVYQDRLRRLAARLSDDVTDLREEAFDTPAAVGEIGNLLADLGDAANHEAERDVTLYVLGSEQNVQVEVEAALERIAAGRFGRCEECGKPIPRLRLRAVPYARRCIVCAI